MVGATPRQSKILEILQKHSPVNVSELVKQLGVTPVTIRRDLTKLEQTGLILRARGSVSLKSATLSFHDGAVERIFTDGQLRIAKKALQYLNSADSILLDAGSTILAFASMIPDDVNLAVATPSLRVAEMLANKPNISLVVSGGNVQPGRLCLYGPYMVEFFSNITADIAFVGTSGVRGQEGPSTNYAFSANMKSSLVKAAQRVVLLAENQKFVTNAMIKFADFKHIDVIITTSPVLAPELFEKIEREGTEIILA